MAQIYEWATKLRLFQARLPNEGTFPQDPNSEQPSAMTQPVPIDHLRQQNVITINVRYPESINNRSVPLNLGQPPFLDRRRPPLYRNSFFVHYLLTNLDWAKANAPWWPPLAYIPRTTILGLSGPRAEPLIVGRRGLDVPHFLITPLADAGV